MHRTTSLMGALLIALTAGGSMADGYLADSAGDVVRNNFGECWRTGYWTQGDAVIGCDGVVARWRRLLRK
jgi:OOP family OmpA-OmpF porin